MKNAFLFLALLSSPAFADSFLGDAIYHGTPVAADGSAWKNTVQLDYPLGGCSGVFITEDTILTAAHCQVPGSGYLVVRLFKENSDEPVVMTISKDEFRAASHPRYQKRNAADPGTDDVGVIVLKNHPLPEGFEPALLQTSKQASASDPGHTAYVAGAGLREGNIDSDRIYFAQGRISSYLYGSVEEIRFPRGVGVCAGDSGGPVFVKANGQLYLTAVTTATPRDLGKNCGSTLFANAITADRYRWINSAMNRLRSEF